jgi:hypothetical protein
MGSSQPGPGRDSPPTRGVDRRHLSPGRTKQVFVRLSTVEYQHIAAAAVRVDLTPTGYVAEAALAAAHATTPPGAPLDATGITRTDLARLQRELFATRTAVARIGANLNQAVAALHTLGRPPDRLHPAAAHCQQVLNALDALVAAIDGRLR